MNLFVRLFPQGPWLRRVCVSERCLPEVGRGEVTTLNQFCSFMGKAYRNGSHEACFSVLYSIFNVKFYRVPVRGVKRKCRLLSIPSCSWGAG